MSDIETIKMLEFIKRQAIAVDQLTSVMNEFQEEFRGIKIQISGLSEIIKLAVERLREMEKCFGN